MIRARIVAVLAAVVAVAGLALAPAAGAATLTGHPAHGAPAAHRFPGGSSGPWVITEKNGVNYNVYTTAQIVGNIFIESDVTGTQFTVDNFGTYGPYTAIYLKLSGGNVMATTDDCDGVVVKASTSDNGTVWALKNTGDGTSVWLINRRCDEPPYGNSEYDEVLSGVGIFGQPYIIAPIGAGGFFEKFIIHSPGM